MMDVIEWLTERRKNCDRLALSKFGEDRRGWEEDARYFDLAIARLRAAEAIVAKLPLTFSALRKANASRAIKWHNGEKAELCFRATELAGEVGEICNAVKKLDRLQKGMKGGKDTMENLAEELGDGAICLDLLAMDVGIDLGEAVAKKFNATSEKHGFSERLPVHTAARAASAPSPPAQGGTEGGGA